MHGTIVVGSGNLFYSKIPLSNNWMISLSVGFGSLKAFIPKANETDMSKTKVMIVFICRLIIINKKDIYLALMT